MCSRYASFSQKANLLRSSIHIRSNLLPGIKNGHKVQALFVNVIYEDQVLLRQTEKRGPFRKNKTPLCGFEPFSNSIFMVQLSQILNIRHLEVLFIQTILISTVFLKNNSMQTDMDIQT